MSPLFYAAGASGSGPLTFATAKVQQKNDIRKGVHQKNVLRGVFFKSEK